MVESQELVRKIEVPADKMKAIVFDKDVQLRTDYPAPAARPDEVIVKVHCAGVCRTDLEILKGYMGFRGILGHEFVGTVIEGPARWQGRRVVSEINCVCGSCEMCRSGLGNHCPNRTVLGIVGRNGVMAEKVAVPLANLHEIPETLPDDQAVFVEPLAAAYQVLRHAEVAGKRVLVVGDGRLGQLASRVLKNVGGTGELLLVGKYDAKLQLARRQGIETILRDEFSPDLSWDVVVDATGTPGGFELAMQAVRPCGTIVLKSTFAAESGMNLATLVVNEIIVVGSRCGPFDQAIEGLETGAVEVTDLISGRFALADGVEALEAAAESKNLKVLIDVR